MIRRALLCALMAVVALALLPAPAVHAQTNSCTNSVAIDVAMGATQELVPVRPGNTTVVCGFVITASAADTIAQFFTGTGTTCATGPVSLTGAMLLADNGNISYGGGNGVIFSGKLSNAICVTAGTGALTGVLTYR